MAGGGATRGQPASTQHNTNDTETSGGGNDATTAAPTTTTTKSTTNNNTSSKVRDYKVWSQDEEDALREGVARHGLGAWEVIRHDETFQVLKSRTGVQLKDKWRNLVKFKHVNSSDLGVIQANTKQFYKNRRGRKPKPTGGSANANANASGSANAANPDGTAAATTSDPAAGVEREAGKLKGRRRGKGKKNSRKKSEEEALEEEALVQHVIDATNPNSAGTKHHLDADGLPSSMTAALNDKSNHSVHEMMELYGGSGGGGGGGGGTTTGGQGLGLHSASDPSGGGGGSSKEQVVQLYGAYSQAWEVINEAKYNGQDKKGETTTTTRTNTNVVAANASDGADGAELIIPAVAASPASERQKKPDRRRRSRGTTVKEDRRFGIYDERRYVPIYNNNSNKVAADNEEEAEAGPSGSMGVKRRRPSLSTGEEATTTASKARGGKKRKKVEPNGTKKDGDQDEMEVEDMMVDGEDQPKLEAHEYPLKKNGFKMAKKDKEDAPGQSPEQGGMNSNNPNNDPKWVDMKSLPPKKAAAARHKQMEEAKAASTSDGAHQIQN